MRGQRVVVTSLESHRGTRIESAEPEFVSKTIGRVMSDPDPIGWVKVSFPNLDFYLDLPAECLRPVRY